MARTPAFPALFSAFAVALVAAAIGDPLVEFVSNTGFFGSAFADASQQSVVPVLFAGLGIAALAGIARLRDRLSSDGNPRRRLREIAKALATSTAPRNVAAIFIAQIAIVFVMERSEAFLGCGQAPHGLSWLGAPVLFSLSVHFVVCVACAVGVRSIARSLLAGVVAAICDVLDRLIVILSRDASTAPPLRSQQRRFARYELVCVHRRRGRAPPTFAASA